jgi:hypothetical protein
VRFFASKNLGHGFRVGVSEDARRVMGTSPSKPRKLTKVIADAISEAEQAHAALERSVVEVGRNAAELEQRVAAHHAILERQDRKALAG